MEHKKVSIVIPVFNAENFLQKSIHSCLNQTLHDIEIILIDDCSTDHSAQIIRDYEKRFPNIIHTIFCTKNGRQGAARNRGLEIASGEYLAFVDADDWIEPDMCEVLYNAAKKADADMAGGNMLFDNDRETASSKYRQYPYTTADLGAEHKDNVGYYSYYCGLFCTRIYRNKLIQDHKIRFLEHVSYEDSFFNYLTALYANKVVKVERGFYHYYYNPNSTTKSKNDVRQYQRLFVIEETYKECKRRGLYDVFRDEIDFKYYFMLASSIIPFVRGFDKPDTSKFVEIRSMVLTNTPEYHKNKYYNILLAKHRVGLFAVMHFPKWIPLLKAIIK